MVVSGFFMASITEKLKPFIAEERLDLLEQKLALRTRYITVCLQDIYYSQNAGAILRSAEAFGIQDIHIIEDLNPFEINHKVERGCTKWLHLHKYDKSEYLNPHQAAIERLRKEGYRIVVASPHIHGKTPESLPLETGKIALIMGTERDGASPWMMEQADEFLHIEMAGFVESLNVSVSAAISLHTLCQRLRNSVIPWQLSENERQDLLLEWTQKSIRNIDSIMHLIENGKL